MALPPLRWGLLPLRLNPITNTPTASTNTCRHTTIFFRSASSARRTTKHLRIRPDRSFLPLPAIPTGSHASYPVSTSTREGGAGVNGASLIYNPPASMPSVYTTPSLFLPKNDPRKSYYPPNPTSLAVPASSSSSEQNSQTTPTTEPTSATKLPPSIKPIKEKKYHLTPEQIEEIRALRAADPAKNSRNELAKRYKASRFFIGMVAEAPEEHKQKQLEELEMVKSMWGKKRREARKERAKRREMWGRDETWSP